MSNNQIFTERTPNDNSMKFILRDDINTGEIISYNNKSEAKDLPIASSLFNINSVTKVSLKENIITVSTNNSQNWSELSQEIVNAISNSITQHNPDFQKTEKEGDSNAELEKINEIIDQNIRPGLQGDGGDIDVISFKDMTLIVRYTGSCQTCSSATTHTLKAISDILQDRYDKNIRVEITG